MSVALTLQQFNALSEADAADVLRQCCAAEAWINAMVASRPYDTLSAVLQQADKHWATMDEANLLEAFSAHPQIGNVDTLRAKYANTKVLASGEQSAVSDADETTLQALATGNQDYLEKNGFIFIVCATGKSADEMLALLQARLPNSRAQELTNAAEEQRKITALRLQKLFQV
ncbi:MAG: 2-oxo-4-hydroxy-4-carboxy-5-ureidoimidazoline decarboxylase [Ketobacter sp.]|nr:MAG: 2-oxo-4-hydroxy-4-carboxy-5-ureidoimidazoline decarboxylase [Ketobacter sp.]